MSSSPGRARRRSAFSARCFSDAGGCVVWELAAYDKRDANPYAELWSEHFSGSEIRAQIIADYGIDIGRFVSMAFNKSPGGRPISVVVRGSSRSVDLNGDQFLRFTLGLPSTLVRTTPFSRV